MAPPWPWSAARSYQCTASSLLFSIPCAVSAACISEEEEGGLYHEEGGGYLAGCKAEGEAELRHGVALLGRLLVPLGRLGEVLRHPPPFSQAHPGIILCRGVA
jgi:hypothetical protein